METWKRALVYYLVDFASFNSEVTLLGVSHDDSLDTGDLSEVELGHGFHDLLLSARSLGLTLLLDWSVGFGLGDLLDDGLGGGDWGGFSFGHIGNVLKSGLGFS